MANRHSLSGSRLDLVFTGEHPTLNREALRKLATANGHKVRTSFCSKTNTVIASMDAVQKRTLKFRSALAKGLRVISYQEFLGET